MHWSSSGQDSAPVMRQRGFESHPVPFLFASECRFVEGLHIRDVRLLKGGTALAIRVPRVRNWGRCAKNEDLVRGRPPFKFDYADCGELRCGPMVRRLPVKETNAGSIPATAVATRQEGMRPARKQVPITPMWVRVARIPKQDVPLAERQRCQPSKLARWVRLPQGILEDAFSGIG